MQPNIERRAPSTPRLPVDLLVELSHDGDDEVYEADAIDLGRGGIGLRAAVLPEIGQRLRCRFDLPSTGESCEAIGEVVWAHDAGRFRGAFGVRFEGLDARARHALDALTPDLYERSADEIAAAEAALAATGAARTVKVRLDGVASEIEGELVAEGANVVVEQAMPFLRIGRGAELENRGEKMHGTLERVRLRVEDGLPRLLLEFRAAQPSPVKTHEDDVVADAFEAPSSEATLQDEELASLVPASVVAASGDRVVEARPSAIAARHAIDEDAPDVDEPAASASDVDAFASDDAIAAAEPAEAAPQRKPRKDEVRVVVRREEPQTDEERERALAMMQPDPTPAERAKELLDGARVAATKGYGASRDLAIVVGRHATPALVKARDGALAFWRRLLAFVAQRAPMLGRRLGVAAAPKRRTTTAPPAAVAAAPVRRTRGAVAPAPEPVPSMRGRGRVVLLAALVASVVGLASYGLAQGDDAPAPIELPPGAAPVTAGPAPTIASPTVPPTTGVVTQAETLEPIALDEAAAMPSAPLPEERGMPEAATQVGPMPAPSYPTLAERRTDGVPSTPPVAAAAVAPVAPAPVAAPVTSTSFGAATVERGRTTTLRMTVPIRGVEGQEMNDGFTVTIPGSHSLDRGALIRERASDVVERATIFNRGADGQSPHSVLTVYFVPGRRPPYRVEANGSSLTVTIGR